MSLDRRLRDALQRSSSVVDPDVGRNLAIVWRRTRRAVIRQRVTTTLLAAAMVAAAVVLGPRLLDIIRSQHETPPARPSPSALVGSYNADLTGAGGPLATARLAGPWTLTLNGDGSILWNAPPGSGVTEGLLGSGHLVGVARQAPRLRCDRGPAARHLPGDRNPARHQPLPIPVPGQWRRFVLVDPLRRNPHAGHSARRLPASSSDPDVGAVAGPVNTTARPALCDEHEIKDRPAAGPRRRALRVHLRQGIGPSRLPADLPARRLPGRDRDDRAHRRLVRDAHRPGPPRRPQPREAQAVRGQDPAGHQPARPRPGAVARRRPGRGARLRDARRPDRRARPRGDRAERPRDRPVRTQPGLPGGRHAPVLADERASRRPANPQRVPRRDLGVP